MGVSGFHVRRLLAWFFGLSTGFFGIRQCQASPPLYAERH